MPVFVIIYDRTNGEQGANLNYRVWEFAKIRLLGYHFRGNVPGTDAFYSQKWILFEFLGWGAECRPPA
jgi:hypothetical protein